jgi:hypothetical protein
MQLINDRENVGSLIVNHDPFSMDSAGDFHYNERGEE